MINYLKNLQSSENYALNHAENIGEQAAPFARSGCELLARVPSHSKLYGCDCGRGEYKKGEE